MPTISITGAGVEFHCGADDTLLRAGLRAGLGLPYECNVGSCGTCKFDLQSGETTPPEPTHVGLSSRDLTRGRRLACQSRPLSDCRIALHLEDCYAPRYRPVRQAGRLQTIEKVTHDMSCFTFRTEQPARFVPGQYALLHIEGVAPPRAYSMSNLPNDDGLWQFMVRWVPDGVVSTYLVTQAEPGISVQLDGPYGMAFYRSSQEVVCIAGGSGLAPMLSIARAAAADPACRRIIFFYGGRTPKDLCAEPYLQKIGRLDLEIDHHGVVSQCANSSERPWNGPRGLIHEYLASSLVPSLDAGYFIAGPPQMVEAVENVLGPVFSVPRERIQYDRFY